MFSRERQLEIREFYNELKVEKSNEDYEWIPTGWLIKWMSCEQHVPPIDNFHDLCPHRR